MPFIPEQPEPGPPAQSPTSGPGTTGIPGIPWSIDTSPGATGRRRLKFFHGVAFIMGGGIGLVRPGPWLLVAGAVWLVSLAWTARRTLPVNAAAVTELGRQMTELYATINRTNTEIESARQAAEAAPAKPQQDEPPRPPA